MEAALDILVFVLVFAVFLIVVLVAVIGSLALASLVGRKAYHATSKVTENSFAKLIVALIFAGPTLVLSTTGSRLLFEKIGLLGVFGRYGFV